MPGTAWLAGFADGARSVELYDIRRAEVLDLLGRYLPSLDRDDLTAVRALRDYADDPCVRVLRACLAHRFGDRQRRPPV